MTATKSFVCECNQNHSIELGLEPTRIKVYCECGITHQVISTTKGIYVYTPKKNNKVKSKYTKVGGIIPDYSFHTWAPGPMGATGPPGPTGGCALAKITCDCVAPIEPPKDNKEKIGEEKSKETDHESEDDESGEEDYESEKENTCDFANLTGEYTGYKMCPRPVQEDTGGTYCELHEVLNKYLCLDDFPEKNTKGPGKKDRWSLFFKEGF